MNNKKAFVTGTTGQDGSYLAELLLSKGYEVHGLIRRTSHFNRDNIDHIKNKDFHLYYGDLEDTSSLCHLMKDIRPDEVYHLASMSHVQISNDIPEYTFDTNAQGTVRLLESIRLADINPGIYNAATSELFGGCKPGELLNEESTMHPRSPYAISKLYSYWTMRYYRDAYGMKTWNGILFNHESILKNSPVIIRDKNGLINILPIEDLFKSKDHKWEGIRTEYKEKEIWTGENWSLIINGTCYHKKHKKVKLIQTRKSCYEATEEHISFNEKNNEIKTKDWKINDKSFDCHYPEQNNILHGCKEISKFLGFLVGDGYISPNGRIRITGISKNELVDIARLITMKFGWTYRLKNYGPGRYKNCKKNVWHLDINNDSNFGLWLRKQIYTIYSNEKRVPEFIINSDKETKKAFFDGYYLADGRNAGNETYAYKGYTTGSSTLALGLNYIFKSFSDQEIKTKCEIREGKRYYYTQFRTDNKDIGGKGNHLKKELGQIIKIIDTTSEDDWFYDLQTESQTFATGPNLFKIHNSPRRGENFITRKITLSIARILSGKQQYLEVGNIDARRDWGYSPEYCMAMWLMLQSGKPDDYVVATGKTHSVREFIEKACDVVGVKPETIVKVNPSYIRPVDVGCLCGNASKIKRVVGWESNVCFSELVDIMMKADMEKSIWK